MFMSMVSPPTQRESRASEKLKKKITGDNIFICFFISRSLVLTAFAWGFFSYENSIMCDVQASIKMMRATVSLMIRIWNL